MDEMEREAIDGIVKGDALAAAGGVLELVDLGGVGLFGQCLGGVDEILLGLDHEGSTGELGRVGGFEGEDEGLGAVAAKVCRLANLGSLEEAKVLGELSCLFNLLVLVVDVGDPHQLDLFEGGRRKSGRHDCS